MTLQQSIDGKINYYNDCKKHFFETYYNDVSINHCGWYNTNDQFKTYDAFLSLIDKSGNIIDLGCGNGMLLKYLIDNSSFKLIPHGVDFLIKSVNEAKLSFPKFSDNFSAENVFNFRSANKKFNYVLTSLSYVHFDHMHQYFLNCKELLNANGRLILYEYDGSPYLKSIKDILKKFLVENVKYIIKERAIIVCIN
ncbi:MAG: class I SAM-dependent methyltransferase [Bacteroidales bacterium]